MNTEDYIKTIEVNGKEIKIGLDDYGQCYYIEYTDEGKLKEEGLGTYNVRYMEEIYSMFDENFRNLDKKMFFGEEMTDEEKNEYENYLKKFEEEYKR